MLVVASYSALFALFDGVKLLSKSSHKPQYQGNNDTGYDKLNQAKAHNVFGFQASYGKYG